MVFHPPQASQRPCQRWLTAPQFWQTKEARGLAIAGFLDHEQLAVA
jgi:hypothetical protein